MFGLKGFDVVIGNPPWGAKLSKQTKAILKQNYPEIDSSTPNSFAYFIGAARRFSKCSISYVLPDAFLIKDYAKTRALLYPNITRLNWYLNTGIPEDFRPFIYVEHDVCVVISNQSTTSEECHVSKCIYDADVRKSAFVDDDLRKDEFIFSKHDHIYNLKVSRASYKIMMQMETTETLADLMQCHEGIHTGNSRELLFLDHKANEHCHPLYYGGRAGDAIRNYNSKPKGWYVDYRSTIIDKSKGFYASLRDERIFSKPKIYITRTGNPIKAFFDESTYASNNFFSLQFKDYNSNSRDRLLRVLPLILSSCANYYIRNFAAPRLGNTYIETKIIHLNRIPIPNDFFADSSPLAMLTELMVAAVKKDVQEACFLESLIDACVMECYFRGHMAQRDLLFHDTITEALQDYDPEASETEQVNYLETVHQRLIAAKIPERLARIPEASPDLLAVILNEGKV